MEVTLFGIVTLVSPLQPWNAPWLMEVMLLGRVTLVRPVQSRNALSPMEVTLLGIVTLVRPVHRENAWSPMEVILLGRVTLVRLVQLANALVPMEVTGRLLIVVGMINTPRALGLLPVIVMAVPLLENNNSGAGAHNAVGRRPKDAPQPVLPAM